MAMIFPRKIQTEKRKNFQKKKYKEKEPGGSSDKRRQYCIIRNWSVVLHHGSCYINVFIAF